MDQAEQDAFFIEGMEEAIDYMVNGNLRDLKDLLELIEAMKRGNSDDVAEALEFIKRNHYRIFDDGIFHLPHKPLQDEVEKLMGMARGIARDMAEPEEGE